VAIGVSAAVAGGAQAQVVVAAPDVHAGPGQTVAVPFAISGTENATATYTAEIEYDPGQVEADLLCAGGPNHGRTCTGAANCPNGVCAPNCTRDNRLLAQTLQATRPEPGLLILFIGDLTFPVATFGDGPLLRCNFRVADAAMSGSHLLDTTFLEIGDATGDVIPASVDDAAVVVGASCAADCDHDGRTTGGEITRAVLILGQAMPLEDCPAADANRDFRTSGSDITRGVVALGAGAACVPE
jgi:hypothetical protein